MTVAEMQSRIKELEAERDLLKSKIRASDIRSIPVESVVRHPWVNEAFGKDGLGTEPYRNNLSAILRYVLFGKYTDGYIEGYRLVDPVTGKQYKYASRLDPDERKQIERRLVEKKVPIYRRCSVNLKEMTPEQWEKYQKAFEAVMCALEGFVSEDWRKE